MVGIGWGSTIFGNLLLFTVVFCQDLTEYCQTHRDAYSKIGPIRTTVAAIAGQEINLPCNPECGERANPSSRKIWFERNLKNKENKLQLDMNSDDSMNRIYENANHSLIIKNVGENDLGIYFCREMPLTTGGEQPEPGIYYYLDLEDISLLTAPPPEEGDWPDYAHTHYRTLSDINMRVIPRFTDPEEQMWAVYTSWASWGPCSSCERPGIRKKEGRCRARRLPDWKYRRYYPSLTPRQQELFRALREVNYGFSCYSRILNELPNVKKAVSVLPPYVLIEPCEVTCEQLNIDLKKWLGKSMATFPGGEHESEKGKGGSDQMYTIVRRETVGGNIHMACVGSQLNYFTRWLNGTRILRPQRQPDSRVRIDAYGVLHIREIQVYDSAIYTCWVNGQPTARVRLLVSMIPQVEDLGIYVIQLGTAIFMSFLVWLTVMFVRYRQSKGLLRGTPNRQTRGVYRTFLLNKILRRSKHEPTDVVDSLIPDSIKHPGTRAEVDDFSIEEETPLLLEKNNVN